MVVDGPEPGFTIYDLDGASAPRSVRELPRLVLAALRIAWAAGRREAAMAIVLQVVGGLGTGAMVLVGKRVLDGVLTADRSGGGIGSFLPSVLVLGGVTAVLGLLAAMRREHEELLAELTTRYAQARILDVACAVELLAFDTPAFHDRVARAQASVGRAPQVVFGLAAVGMSLAGAVGSLLALLALQPVLAPLPGGAGDRARGPADLTAGRGVLPLAFGMTPRDRERGYLASLLTMRDPAKEVRAFGLVDVLRGRHDRLYAERVAELRQIARRQMRFALLANFASALITGGTLALLVALVLDGRVSLADAAAAAAAIVLLGQRLVYGGFGAGNLYESALFIRDIVSFLQLEQPARPVQDGAPARPPRRAPFPVVAREVSFAYPGADRRALDGVSLEIEPGQVVALVGENGSGKTTLAKLLGALYVPTAGEVLWEGVTTARADRDALRRDAAVIFQDFIRYALPARDNIALGRHGRRDDTAGIYAAARQAGAHEDIERLPRGYDTMLGPAFEGGTDLSFGQWQRLALARVFFRDAPFVILDEPTAALDARARRSSSRRSGSMWQSPGGINSRSSPLKSNGALTRTRWAKRFGTRSSFRRGPSIPIPAT